MLLKNALYLDKQFKLSHGDIFIKDGKIHTITKEEFINVSDEDTVDAKGYILLPGLINAHYHNGSLLTKGLAKEIPLQKWGEKSLQGTIQQTAFEHLDTLLTEEEYKTVLLKGYVELIKNGVTFVSDSGASDRSPDYLVEAMKLLGIKGVIDVEDKLADYMDRVMPNILFTGHLPEEEDISEATLQQAKVFLDTFNTYMMTHCLETVWRKELIYERYGKSTIQLFQERGLLNDKSILFHCVELSNQDIVILSQLGSTVVHCPTSNMAGGGMANIKDCLRNTVNVAIGTDWARSNIWEAMRLAYYLLKVGTYRDEFSAEDIVKMATQNGAKAFGLEKQIGIIEEGYDADLVFLQIDNPALFPLIHHDEFSTVVHNIMFETREEMIQHVMVKGNWVMKGREIMGIDEVELNLKYKEIFHKIFGDYHIS